MIFVWKPVTIGAPYLQRQILFNVFINDRDKGTVYTLRSFANKKGEADRLDGCAIQRNLNRLEKWKNRNLAKLKKSGILSS